jgi:hypothetical protein
MAATDDDEEEMMLLATLGAELDMAAEAEEDNEELVVSCSLKRMCWFAGTIADEMAAVDNDNDEALDEDNEEPTSA